jgi:hypothetical protein
MRAIRTGATVAIVVILGLLGCRRTHAPVASPNPAAASPSVPSATAWFPERETAPIAPVPTPGAPTSAAATPSREDLEYAIDRIEEERSSAGGVATPSELRHYPDTRRFLALQIADAQEAALEIPHDDAELIEMIRAGKFVRLAPMTDTYLLYEIGEDAKDDPLIHYEVERNKDVPLLPSVEAIDRKKAELDGQGTKGRAQKAVLETYYGDAAGRDTLFREYQEVASFAAENGYSLADPQDRVRMHRDLLSYIRPEARGHRAQGGGRLPSPVRPAPPVTSVVRTERYQRRLGGCERGTATRVEIAPHTTGEAVRRLYRYMAPDEQNFVMDLVARLEDQQKVEALRENRGHIHIYAFAEGTRPPEARVDAARSSWTPRARNGRKRAGPTRRPARPKAKRKPPVKADVGARANRSLITRP